MFEKISKTMDGMNAPIITLRGEIKRINEILNDKWDCRSCNSWRDMLEKIKEKHLTVIKILEGNIEK